MADSRAKRREERVKLFATFLSNGGLATIVTGAIGPAVTGRFQSVPALVCFLVGLSLHFTAQALLHYDATGLEETC